MLPPMSDAGQPAAQEPEGNQPPAVSDAANEQIRKARQEAREWRTKHDDLYRQLQESQRQQGGSQTELERLSGQIKTLTDQVQAEQQARQAAQLQALRVQVAARKGLSPKFASRLQGETEADLEADADDILAALPQGAGGGQQGEGPSSDNGQQQPPPRPSNAGQHSQGRPPAGKTENDYFRELWSNKR